MQIKEVAVAKVMILSSRNQFQGAMPLARLTTLVERVQLHGVTASVLIDPTAQELIDTVKQGEPDLIFPDCLLSFPSISHPFYFHECLIDWKNRIVGSSIAVHLEALDKTRTSAGSNHGIEGFVVDRPMAMEPWLLERVSRIPRPYFVKPNALGGSRGISEQSRAEGTSDAVRRVRFLFDTMPDVSSVRVETYIAGVEYTVAVLKQGDRFRTSVSTLKPESGPSAIFTEDLKAARYEDRGVKYSLAEPSSRDRFATAAIREFDRLKMQDYARVDMIDSDGTLKLIEVNSQPNLGRAFSFEWKQDWEENLYVLLEAACRNRGLCLSPGTSMWHAGQ